jgi:hypothetical protein
MFQRLQSLYLLLAALCISGLFFLPVLQIRIVDAIYDFNVTGLYYIVNGKEQNLIGFPFVLIIPAIFIFTFSIIFLYKKQETQLKLGRLNYILILLLIVMIIFSTNGALEKMKNSDVARISYQGFYFPVAAIAFVFLANRAIKRELEILKIFEKMKKK